MYTSEITVAKENISVLHYFSSSSFHSEYASVAHGWEEQIVFQFVQLTWRLLFQYSSKLQFPVFFYMRKERTFLGGKRHLLLLYYYSQASVLFINKCKDLLHTYDIYSIMKLVFTKKDLKHI